MEVQLSDMLPRITAGSAHQDQAGLVNGLAVRLIQNFAKIEMVGVEFFPRRVGEKELSQCSFCVRTTDSDNGDPTLAWGCRNGGNGIMLVHNSPKSKRVIQ